MPQVVADGRRKNVSVTGRVALLLCLVVLAVGNSLFLFFVIWDQLPEGRLISTLTFAVSASAHLLYLFLPWFARDLLLPVFYDRVASSSRYGRADRAAAGGEVGFLPAVMMVIGAGLCIAAFGFWFVASDPFRWRQEPLQPYISAANCESVGGRIVERDGRIICDLGAGGSNAGTAPAAGSN